MAGAMAGEGWSLKLVPWQELQRERRARRLVGERWRGQLAVALVGEPWQER